MSEYYRARNTFGDDDVISTTITSAPIQGSSDWTKQFAALAPAPSSGAKIPAMFPGVPGMMIPPPASSSNVTTIAIVGGIGLVAVLLLATKKRS